MTTGKTIALTRWTFVGKVMSLIFNMLSRLVIAFLPRSKHILITWLPSPSAVILEPKNEVCHYFHCFHLYLTWNDGTRYHHLHFLNVKLTVSPYKCLMLIVEETVRNSLSFRSIYMIDRKYDHCLRQTRISRWPSRTWCQIQVI